MVDLSNPWERSILKGDLSRVVPKRELSRLHELVHEAVEKKVSLVELFLALAEKDPIALADLAVGPRSVGGSSVTASLKVLDTLEASVSPGGLYRRLLVLADDQAVDVLHAATQRHPTASWLVKLSEKVERSAPGLMQLHAARSHPMLAELCWEHARAGHSAALVELARPEAVAALIAADQIESAIEAAVGVLEQDPAAPLGAWAAGAWGPSLDPFFLKLVNHLKSRSAALALQREARACPKTLALLSIVLPGLR